MTDTTNHPTCIVCGGLQNLTYFATLDRWYCRECWPASEAYRIEPTTEGE